MCSSSDVKIASASALGRNQHSKFDIWTGLQALEMLHAPKPSNQNVQFNVHFVGDSWRDRAELCVTLEDLVNGPTDPSQAAEVVAERTDKTQQAAVEGADPASLCGCLTPALELQQLQARLSMCQQSLWQPVAVGAVPVAKMCPKQQLLLGCVAAHSSALGSSQAVPAPNMPQPEDGGAGAPCSWAGGVEP